jgi:hypothetical protein
MNLRKSLRLSLVLASSITLVGFASQSSFAQVVSCETFNPCTAGVCLKNGTCEAVPANDGATCETGNPCTVGECNDGTCVATPANDGEDCETFDYCVEKDGMCSGGECVADVLPNNSPCRADVLGPCFTGTCTTIATFSFCTPELKCGNLESPCEFNCNFVTGACETSQTHICDDACTTATCVPGESEFEHTCTNRTNRPANTPCEDGSTCTGNDKCDSGECVGVPSTGEAVCGDGLVSAPEQCDDGDAVFVKGEYCDDGCELVPCGKPTNATGTLPKTGDALFALRTAVGLSDCDLAVCDVNDSGKVTTGDALSILKKAVGLTVTFNCPAAVA